MGNMTQAKTSGDPMLAVLGQTGSLEELKDERISLQLARGRVYDILSSAFSYPWNRKFFRPKSLLEPMDIVLVDEEDWNHVKSIIEGFSKYLPKMTVKQVQQEYVRVFGHAVSMECPPYEMQYGTEGGIQSQTDVLIQLGGFYDTFGFIININTALPNPATHINPLNIPLKIVISKLLSLYMSLSNDSSPIISILRIHSKYSIGHFSSSSLILSSIASSTSNKSVLKVPSSC